MDLWRIQYKLPMRVSLCLVMIRTPYYILKKWRRSLGKTLPEEGQCLENLSFQLKWKNPAS